MTKPLLNIKCYNYIVEMKHLQQAEIIKKSFTNELHAAAANKPTSLSFIKHQLPAKKLVNDGEVFQVMVFGGTVFTKALVKKVNNEVIILEKQQQDHPAIRTGEMFLQFLTEQVYPQIYSLAINFAFPLKPFIRNGKLDGVLLSATKSNNAFSGLINKPVGKVVEAYLFEKLQAAVNVLVVNDAVCLLLAGANKYKAEYLIGAIMGTGTNTTMFHNSFAINIQSGEFNNFSPSEECLNVDKKSTAPGVSLFEKETAGGYLYKQFNYLLQKYGFNHPLINSTKELYGVTKNIKNEKAVTLAQLLFEKSAALMAGQIAGLAEFKKHDLNLIIEGSAYWDNSLYQEYFKNYLDKLSPAIKIELKGIENSSIIGAVNLASWPEEK